MDPICLHISRKRILNQTRGGSPATVKKRHLCSSGCYQGREDHEMSRTEFSPEDLPATVQKRQLHSGCHQGREDHEVSSNTQQQTSATIAVIENRVLSRGFSSANTLVLYRGFKTSLHSERLKIVRGLSR